MTHASHIHSILDHQYLLSTKATTKHISTMTKTDKQNIITIIGMFWLSELLPSSPRDRGVIATTLVMLSVVCRQELSLHTYRVAISRSSLDVSLSFSNSSFTFPAINPSTVTSKYAVCSSTH